MLRYLYKTLTILFVIAALVVLAAHLADALIHWLFSLSASEFYYTPR